MSAHPKYLNDPGRRQPTWEVTKSTQTSICTDKGSGSYECTSPITDPKKYGLCDVCFDRLHGLRAEDSFMANSPEWGPIPPSDQGWTPSTPSNLSEPLTPQDSEPEAGDGDSAADNDLPYCDNSAPLESARDKASATSNAYCGQDSSPYNTQSTSHGRPPIEYHDPKTLVKEPSAKGDSKKWLEVVNNPSESANPIHESAGDSLVAPMNVHQDQSSANNIQPAFGHHNTITSTQKCNPGDSSKTWCKIVNDNSQNSANTSQDSTRDKVVVLRNAHQGQPSSSFDTQPTSYRQSSVDQHQESSVRYYNCEGRLPSINELTRGCEKWWDNDHPRRELPRMIFRSQPQLTTYFPRNVSATPGISQGYSQQLYGATSSGNNAPQPNHNWPSCEIWWLKRKNQYERGCFEDGQNPVVEGTDFFNNPQHTEERNISLTTKLSKVNEPTGQCLQIVKDKSSQQYRSCNRKADNGFCTAPGHCWEDRGIPQDEASPVSCVSDNSPRENKRHKT
ncbi:hypothetical protein NHQ30_002579 [Ciborinia camelliae]|nr:hypothetical protein NHQ30_002579 [Ciborinia camelliae]